MRKILLVAFFSALLFLALVAPVMAQEATATTANSSAVNWKAISAAVAVAGSAFASAWAQSKIGSAAAGALAEKPELGGIFIVLEAIPETMIILGFVVALLIMVMA